MKNRRNRGYALVTTIVIGFTSIAFLLALASIVTQAVHSVSANKWNESLRNAAEIGIEYSVNQYNTVNPCLLDQFSSVQLPLAYLESGGANSGISNVTVKLQATQLSAADWAYLRANASSIYSPALDPYYTPFTAFTNAPANAPPSANFIPVAAPGGFRVLESTATNQIYSKTIRVILRARFDLIYSDPSNPSNPNLVFSQPAPTPNQNYFNLPLFSNGILTVSPATNINGVNSLNPNASNVYNVPADVVHNIPAYNRFNLNVTTNTQAIVAGQINGDVSVASSGSGSTAVATVANNALVNGRLLTNGVQSGVVAPTGNFPSGNVQATADLTPGITQRLSLNNTNPAASSLGLAQNSVASAPESSSGLELPTLEQQSLIPNAAPIAGKDYSIPGLDTSNLASPVVIQNASTPTRFFVDDPPNAGTTSVTNPNAAAINVQTSMLATQNDPVNGGRNLQIYYDGSLPVNINVDTTNFSALIYAPNAAVTINGAGTFNGAVVGGTVTANLNGTMNLYTDLAISAKTQPSPGVLGNNWSGTDIANAYKANQGAGLQYFKGTNGPFITGWQPVTWQEL